MVVGTFSMTVVAKAWLRSRSISVRRRSVMSSCVTTQPLPSGVGWLFTAMMRPSGSSMAVLVGSRLCIVSSRSAMYCCGSAAKNVPLAMRACTSSSTEHPGFTTSAERPYISKVALVADHQPPGRIEHVEALRHVVQRGVELQLLLADLILGVAPLGDVLVGGDPAAARHRLVEHLDRSGLRSS